MTENVRENDKFVVPGKKLGVIEEFLPGEGTFEENGNIYSKIIGITKFDLKSKVASVNPKARKPVVPTENEVVMGMVTRSQKKIAQVEIFTLGANRLSNPFTGILHISSSSPSYQETMKDVCKTGDIIRAKIINDKSVLPQLTTIGREFGVIKAFCSRCGQTLAFKNRSLRCEACGNVEHRKIAEDYHKNAV